MKTLSTVLVALCAAMLTACSGGSKGNGGAEGIIDYLAYENNGDGRAAMSSSCPRT